MSASSLIFEIIGIDHASKEFHKVSSAMEKTEDRSKKLKVAGGIALAALAAGAVEFGKKAVDKFQEVGGETITLQRQLGLTAQQASRLRFAGEETGVTAQQLGTTFGILSKHLSANDKAWKSLGVSTKDAQGKTKSMNDLIPQIADRFAKMQNGPQKTALAMQLFGRSGKDLLPFLNKGAAGIKDLNAESDKYGDTLNQKDTQAVYKNVIAKRQLGAAISGLEIQLGQKLLPIVTSVVAWFTRTVLWFSKLSTTTKDVIKVIVAVVAVIATVVQIVKIWTAVQAALNLVLDANPIGLIIIAVAALAIGLIYAYKHSKTFRDIINGAFHAIAAAGSWMWNKVLKPIFAALVAAFNAAKAAASWVASIAGGGGPSNAAVSNTGQHGGAGGQVSGHVHAGGGPIMAGIPYIINERARESVTFPANGTVHQANITPMMASGRNNDINGSVPLIIQMEGRAVYQGLLTFKRRNGITSMGLA